MYQQQPPQRPSLASARPQPAVPTVGGQAVATVQIKGRPYVPVAERIRLAHAGAEPFEVLQSDVLPLGDSGRWYCRVTIRIGERRYQGSSEIRLTGAAPNTPEATSPLEVAETSAVGRALAMAGVGLLDSVASADELQRVTQRGA